MSMTSTKPTKPVKQLSTALIHEQATVGHRHSVETRDTTIARLERESARWRRGFAVTAALLAVFVLVGAGPKVIAPDRLAAGSFVLLDGDGNVRGEWRLGADGPEFASYDSNGSLVAVMATAAVTPPATAKPAPPRSEVGEKSGRILLGAPPASESDDDDFNWAD